jgi:ParB-like chromosome segregation protein Spo0J
VEITSIEVGGRLLKPDTQLIDDLARDVAEHGLLQRIGVRERADGKHDLVWGRHRYEAAAKLGWASIPAVVYPPDTPDRDLAVLEIVENLKRRELTTEERDRHRAELVALLKEQQAEKPSTELTVSGKGGRGRRGIKSRVAEAEGVTKQAIKKSEDRIANAIGEPVDFERDTPPETRRKADKLKAVGKPKRRGGGGGRASAPPKLKSKSRAWVEFVAPGGGVDTYRPPMEGDSFVRHAPAADVVTTLCLILGNKRWIELAEAVRRDIPLTNGQAQPETTGDQPTELVSA